MSAEARYRETRRASHLPLLIGSGVGLLLVLLCADWLFGYVLSSVNDKQVGVQFRASQPYQVVGPGVYSDIAFFAEMKTIDVAGLPFEAADPEVLTKDKQRIGLSMRGTVHRPDVSKGDVLLRNWAQYSIFYTNDEALIGKPARDKEAATPGLMTSLSQQAVKVCVGDLNFDEAVIGSARDVVRDCVDRELDKLAQGYGLEVKNIVVHNVELGKEVQAQLDAITKARFETQIAIQREQQARAEADRELAVQQGAIRVEQGKIQERTKQEALTAKLEQEKLAAQRAVIEAQKANDLFAAEQDLTITTKQREVAEQTARSSLAPELARAGMYETNPRYVELLRTQALASAYRETDKMIVVPAGTDPYVFIGGSGQAIVPTEAH